MLRLLGIVCGFPQKRVGTVFRIPSDITLHRKGSNSYQKDSSLFSTEFSSSWKSCIQIRTREASLALTPTQPPFGWCVLTMVLLCLQTSGQSFANVCDNSSFEISKVQRSQNRERKSFLTNIDIKDKKNNFKPETTDHHVFITQESFNIKGK